MKEFIEQFLVEARELVDQATADLLALEQDPNDAARLDSAFRAFHTLKGAAGIVDFDAMGRALHAVEDVLSLVRAGQRHLSRHLIGESLSALDQVLVWLDAMEASGEPPVGADHAADAIIARVAPQDHAEEPKAAPSVDWQTQLLTKYPEHARQAKTALRYAPNPQAFFAGQDPLQALAKAPGLLVVDLQPAGIWPSLEDFDPFTCQLVISALSGATAEELLVTLADLGRELEVVAVAGEADGSLPPKVESLIKAQIALLKEPTADGFAGRLTAAARTAQSLLRGIGYPAEAAAVQELLQDITPDRLVALLEAVVGGEIIAPSEKTATPSAPLPEGATRALRVDVERIEALVRLSGELLVAKNAVGHVSLLAQDGADSKVLAGMLKEQHGILDRLVAELQRSVVAIRVLPMRHVFQRFPRLVREMGTSTGKPARLVTEGDETEADKTVVEALFEPLLHVLRNAVDHGLETPAERAPSGKPDVATIQLRAARRGEHVIVEVEDDGRGVNVERVRQVALERGVKSADVLAGMSDEGVIDLIFAPGFSTATAITDLSGRGVGMDAVRVGIERLGGRVSVESAPGQGTLVRFTLPFTVMMTRVMTVEAAGQIFGVPLEAVLETVRVPRDLIHPIGAANAFVLRERTVPVFDLASALGNPVTQTPPPEATIVIASSGGDVTGLEVERVGEPMDVMLKPMDGLLAGTTGIAGTTLLGDGRVLIVLDLQDLLQ